jgi:CBS domain containing-hemolysin-like protein
MFINLIAFELPRVEPTNNALNWDNISTSLLTVRLTGQSIPGLSQSYLVAYLLSAELSIPVEEMSCLVTFLLYVELFVVLGQMMPAFPLSYAVSVVLSALLESIMLAFP